MSAAELAELTQITRSVAAARLAAEVRLPLPPRLPSVDLGAVHRAVEAASVRNETATARPPRKEKRAW